jgi:hypothetical protein
MLLSFGLLVRAQVKIRFTVPRLDLHALARREGDTRGTAERA